MSIKYFITVLMLFTKVYSQSMENKISVPLGGNSWVTIKTQNGNEKVTDKGWENWQNKDVVWSTFIRLNKTGKLKVFALLNVSEGESKLQCSINGEKKIIKVSSADTKEYEIGEWNIVQAGYVKIDMQGISKTGKFFANVSELHIQGSAVDDQTAFVKNNEGNYFYWGRRGPSVHINYDLSEVTGNIEWFYNEIRVPKANDVTGSYFMANGFGEGYFGMQVNSPTERRVLFSVWSPFKTDDPKAIPADKKIILLKKGDGVHAGEFGNEGSGGQSYLQYNWKAAETYKFLLRAQPVENNYTNYTAYFYAADQKKWLLIASFSRPATNTYLKKLHSFLENFDPETGYISRKVFYQNQWIKTNTGDWQPLTKMIFTGDATANKGYRLDYDGGEENGKFYLRNCGFFNNNAALKTIFFHLPSAKIPNVDLSALQ